MTKKKAATPPFDKYKYYEASVQNTGADVDFINETYKKIRGKGPKLLREDFCGTGKLMCDWVEQSPEHMAFGLDLDPEPVEYGKKNHLSKLTQDQQKRVSFHLQDVLKSKEFSADVTVAFNFSYFIFKEREVLKKYFKNVKKSLKKNGIFILDLFGGPESMTILEEETEHDEFSYFWDCDKFNPITNECLFGIHFKPKGEKKKRFAFTYDWRMWGMSELVDLLKEVGFENVRTYWEEDGDDDEGNGVFYETKDAENCDSWVTYIVAHQ